MILDISIIKRNKLQNRNKQGSGKKLQKLKNGVKKFFRVKKLKYY